MHYVSIPQRSDFNLTSIPFLILSYVSIPQRSDFNYNEVDSSIGGFIHKFPYRNGLILMVSITVRSVELQKCVSIPQRSDFNDLLCKFIPNEKGGCFHTATV